jgi:hypothetical protein
MSRLNGFMRPQNKKPLLHLCLAGSLTVLAILNMIYLIIKGSDPFTPYLLSDLIGSIPLFPYFVISLNVTIILLIVTLLTLTAVIQADMEELFARYATRRSHAREAAPDAHGKTVAPPIATPRSPVSSEEMTIQALNERVQALNTEVAQHHRDALIQELQDITLAATTAEPVSEQSPLPPRVEDPSAAPQLTLHSPPQTLKGIGVKTEAALKAIDITTVGELLVADPAWVAAHTPLSIHRVQTFQVRAYASVATEAPPSPRLPGIEPRIE